MKQERPVISTVEFRQPFNGLPRTYEAFKLPLRDTWASFYGMGFGYAEGSYEKHWEFFIKVGDESEFNWRTTLRNFQKAGGVHRLNPEEQHLILKLYRDEPVHDFRRVVPLKDDAVLEAFNTQIGRMLIYIQNIRDQNVNMIFF